MLTPPTTQAFFNGTVQLYIFKGRRMELEGEETFVLRMEPVPKSRCVSSGGVMDGEMRLD